jgi:hypothetical protein
MKKSANIAKILADLQIVKQRICRAQQPTDLPALFSEPDAVLRTNHL